MSESIQDNDKIDKPPIFKSWRTLYWLVLGSLAIQVLVFYILTQLYK